MNSSLFVPLSLPVPFFMRHIGTQGCETAEDKLDFSAGAFDPPGTSCLWSMLSCCFDNSVRAVGLVTFPQEKELSLGLRKRLL